MPGERILICGAGVAGSITAFWLAKHDFKVVVIERSRADQKAGQGIEIEEPALAVVKAMGIMDKLEACRTGEKGFKLVDQHSRERAVFNAGNHSPTGALEMMRGDLTQVLYKAADESPNVTYHFETTIEGLRQMEDKVVVQLQSRPTKATRAEEFDFVIAADGVKSRTRSLVMGSSEEIGCLKPIGASIAYFSIPSQPRDWPYSRACHFPGRRIVWLRPVSEKSATTSAYIICCGDDNRVLQQAIAAGDRQKQKEYFAGLFKGLGWEAPRVVENMMKADNFYADRLTQIKLRTWSRGRVAIVGDAAWAPTPFTGEGNQLAILGAWVLAQELARARSTTAFDSYEKRFRSYVEKAQNVPLRGWAMYIFNPKTAGEIWLLRLVLSFLAWLVHTFASKDTSSSSNTAEDMHHEPFDLEMVNSDLIAAR